MIRLLRAHSSGIDGNPTVFYRLMPGSTAQTNKFHTFYLQQRSDNGDTWADVKVNHPLDYESIKEYNLTIRVEVSSQLHTHTHIVGRIGSAFRCALCTFPTRPMRHRQNGRSRIRGAWT